MGAGAGVCRLGVFCQIHYGVTRWGGVWGRFHIFLFCVFVLVGVLGCILYILFDLLKQVIAGRVQKNYDVIHNTKGVYYFQTNELCIKNSQLALIHIDGEPFASSAYVEIILKKNAFKLLHP